MVDLLLVVLAALGAFIFAVAVKVTSDFIAAKLAKRTSEFHVETLSLLLMNTAVRLLPRNMRARYEGEWLMYLSDFNGTSGQKLAEAFLFLRAAISIDVQVLRMPVFFGIKRAMDVSLSATALLMFSPLLSLTALALRLKSGGSIFVSQRRVGKGGELFTIYEFRTIGGAAWGEGPQWEAVEKLPQLWNVLRGDMSMVGPRPYSPEALIAMDPKELALRSKVRPGVLGWAQANEFASAEKEFRRRHEHDLEYIDRFSPMFDVLIVVAAALPQDMPEAGRKAFLDWIRRFVSKE